MLEKLLGAHFFYLDLESETSRIARHAMLAMLQTTSTFLFSFNYSLGTRSIVDASKICMNEATFSISGWTC